MPTRAALLTAFALGLLLACLPAAASADGTNACTVMGTSTSGGAEDLLRVPVWHLRSTDHVAVEAVAGDPQADVVVNAYALGVPFPIARGTSSGGDTTASAEYDVSDLAYLGRVFVVSGHLSGPVANCSGLVQIVIDDVNPWTTVLGAGGAAMGFIGLAMVFWAPRRPLRAGRRLGTLIGVVFLVAGSSLVVQQTIPSLGGEPGGFGTPIAESVLDATQLAPSVTTLLVTLGLTALIVLLMPFPAELFNRTLEENLDRIRAAFRGMPLIGRLIANPDEESEAEGGRSRALRLAAVIVFLVIAGLLYGFLDPGFGLDARSAVTFGGLVAALVAVTWLAALPLRARHKAVDGDTGRLEAVLSTLVVAAACVLISRVAGFLPGYLYGLILGYQFRNELAAEQESGAIHSGAWWMLGLGLACWLVLPAVRAYGVLGTSFGEIGVTVLGAITVAGIEGVVFAMIPLRFLPGEAVFKRGRIGWGILYATGLFAFLWIILNPANGFVGATEQTRVPTAALLFIGFGLASVLFWAYFRLRPTPAEAPA